MHARIKTAMVNDGIASICRRIENFELRVAPDCLVGKLAAAHTRQTYVCEQQVDGLVALDLAQCRRTVLCLDDRVAQIAQYFRTIFANARIIFNEQHCLFGVSIWNCSL